MAYLVRAIKRSRWETEGAGKDVRADAITGCLKTNLNTLSTWRIEQKDAVDDAVLAFVSTNEKLETRHFVLLDEDKVTNVGLEVDATVGNSPVARLNGTHRDLCNLTYASLGKVKDVVLEAIAQESDVVLYDKTKLRGLIKGALEKGDLSIDQLHSKMQFELSKSGR